MGIILDIYIGFIALVFLGMLLIDIAPAIRKKQERKIPGNYNPNVLVMVPCRGNDLTLEDNLKSIASQDYKKCSVIAIVDSKGDSSLKAIEKAGIKWIISSYKGEKASGKVKAIMTALKKFTDYDVYVIADSDILVKRDWLRNLVLPLKDKRTGISTTFPDFVPMGGFWSKVKFVWGFVGQGMMESKAMRFGWGGSLAFRKDLLTNDTLQLLGSSEYSVSDDIPITKAAKDMGLGIAYVKSAQPAVNSDDDFPRFFEWANRQSALSIMGYRRNLYFGIAFYGAEILLFFSAIILAYFVYPVFLVLLAHFLRSEMVTYRRAGNGDPQIAFIVIIMPIIYLLNLILASRTSQITWRGRKYALK